jgi:hypothetical protein
MKYLLSIAFLFTLTIAVASQELNKRNLTKLPGTVSGEITFKEVIGSGLTKFKCSDLVASAAKLGGGGWQRKGRASGDFSKRRCYFVVPSIPAGEQFVAALNAQMPSCDQKSFEATTSFPVAVKPGEAMKYNFSVTKISCVVLK